MAAQHPHHPVKPPPLGLHSRFAVQKALLEWIATHGKAGHMPKPLQVASTDFNYVAYFHGGQLESTSEGKDLLRALAQADGSVHALAARLRLQIAPEEVQCADAGVYDFGRARLCPRLWLCLCKHLWLCRVYTFDCVYGCVCVRLWL